MRSRVPRQDLTRWHYSPRCDLSITQLSTATRGWPELLDGVVSIRPPSREDNRCCRRAQARLSEIEDRTTGQGSRS